jgi:DNA-binding transcriptional LysR family regulator
LSDLVVRYREAHPSFELRFEIGNEATLLGRVSRNELDLAIVAGPVPTSDLQAAPLAVDRPIAVAAPGVARNLGRSLEHATWILREPGSDTRRVTDAWFESRGVGPQRSICVHGPDAVRRAAHAGLGVGVLSIRCVEPDLASGALVRLSLSPALSERRFQIVDHRHKHHGAACRAMIEALGKLGAAGRREAPARRSRRGRE